MLTWALLFLGVVWIVLGVTKTTGFKGKFFEEPLVEQAVCLAFFIFGIFHLVLGVMLFIAPVPFGEIVNQTVSITTNYTADVKNTSHYEYNATGDLSHSAVTESAFINSSVSSRTVTPTYNVFGTELLGFLAFCYQLVLFVYLLLFVIELWRWANGRLKGGRDG